MSEDLFNLLLPELILATVACALFLVGAFSKVAGRRMAPALAMGAVAAAALVLLLRAPEDGKTTFDYSRSVAVSAFSQYIKVLACLVGGVILLLAWPTRADGGGNSAIDYGADAGEFFGLALLSLTGILLTASANDLILLFLALELVSIPTYVMVSISRPVAVAQEAGVKYFFLGAMTAAIMLFGFSYLYGTTGTLKIHEIVAQLHPAVAAPAAPIHRWMLLGVVMLLAGFAFKIAAVPLHFYAGDVYEGAATPVTAYLAFAPKTAGFVAIVKILYAIGGPAWAVPGTVVTMLMWMAILTMTVGNVLGLLQQSVKRVLAYSSIAHSGYMLVGLTVLAGATHGEGSAAHTGTRVDGLAGVLFYLAAYGISNAAAFGVLMLLPARRPNYGAPATGDAHLPSEQSAETFDDIAGQGRRHPGLALAMSVACFSLIGLPLTVGFLGKVLLIKPALEGQFTSLAIITVINAAISAAYYLRIVAALFLRPESDLATDGVAGATSMPAVAMPRQYPVLAAVVLSVIATLFFGAIPSAATRLSGEAARSAAMPQVPASTATPTGGATAAAATAGR